MSVGSFDVELNGVKYDLAEDAQGQTYVLAGEPLRPPNAVTVQGESQQKFQMRPDVLLWSLTDWSGGEGQQKFNSIAPNRWRELTAVRVFQRPGTLQPGWYVEDTQDTTGAADLVKDGVLTIGAGGMFLVAQDTPEVYSWDGANEKWSAATALTGPAAGAEVTQGAGDGTSIFWLEASTGDLWQSDAGTIGTPTKISTGVLTAQQNWVVELGAYVYSIDIIDGTVTETLKNDGSTETTLYDFGGGATGTGFMGGENGLEVQGTILDGKIYFAVRFGDKTVVHEVTPTTAAGAGFGKEMAVLQGFRAWSIWAHSGFLFMGGDVETDEEDAILYLEPGGSYGTLGTVRPNDDIGKIIGQSQGGRMLEHYFATQQIDASTAQTAIWEIDSVSGGYCMIAKNEDGDNTGERVRSVVVYQGDVFVSSHPDALTARTQRARSDQYAKNSEAISPWHDFDLASEKILSSLELATEDLPADWTVYVDYALDGTDSWNNVVTYTTTNGNGVKTAVSTDTTTVKFHSLSIRIRMVYGGAGVPTSGPVVLGVDVRAQVAKPVRVWRLNLDMSDSFGRVGGLSGKQKIENLVAAAATEKVVGFKDGYRNRTPGQFEDVDVIIDSYQLFLSHPGEGFALVTLREVA